MASPNSLQHCLVYGIELLYVDGRVGMAALLPQAAAAAEHALYEGRLTC